MTTLAPTRREDAVVVDDERMAARRAEVDAAQTGRGRRLVRRLLIAIGVFTIVATAAAGAALSPWFAVNDIGIIGADGVDPESIRSWSGLEVGQAIWSINATAVKARLESRPEIREARVRIRWPSAVEVRVVTRVAIARLVPESGGAITVSASGVVMQVEAPESLALMSVRVPDLGDLEVGDSIEPVLAEAVDVVGQLPLAIALRVIAANVDVDGEIRLMGRAGVEIRLGDVRGIDAKLEAAERSLSGQIDQSEMCLIDVRNPRSLVVRRNPDCDPAPLPVETPPGTIADPTVPAAGAEPTPPAVAPQPLPVSPFGGPGAPEPEVVVDEAVPTAPPTG